MKIAETMSAYLKKISYFAVVCSIQVLYKQEKERMFLRQDPVGKWHTRRLWMYGRG